MGEAAEMDEWAADRAALFGDFDPDEDGSLDARCSEESKREELRAMYGIIAARGTVSRNPAWMVPRGADPSGAPEFISVGRVEVTRETAKAIHVCLPSGEETWIPKSQIDAESAARAPGDAGELLVSAWLAEQRGWT